MKVRITVDVDVDAGVGIAVLASQAVRMCTRAEAVEVLTPRFQAIVDEFSTDVVALRNELLERATEGGDTD